jgi:Mitochondrial carrier protein
MCRCAPRNVTLAHKLLRYSAIDMSTFEALKLAYLRSTGKSEPGMLALLAFGSISGSVGATTVYPLNLVRTRLQASGSSGHPERYSGIADVVRKTYGRDGWRGFYRGLVPTLAKVRPPNVLTCHLSSPPCRLSPPFQYPTWCMNRANEGQYSLF